MPHKPKRQHYKDLPSGQSRRIKSLRVLTGLTRKEFSVKHHISISTLQSWEEGRGKGLTNKSTQRTLEALQREGIYCTAEWLIYGVGEGPRFLQSSKFILPSDNLQYEVDYELEEKTFKEISFFQKLYKDAQVTVVMDDGMLPFFSIGDNIGGLKFYESDIVKAIGKNCIVETEDNQILFRQLNLSRIDNKYTLNCINPFTTVSPQTLYDVTIISAAPVIFIRKR